MARNELPVHCVQEVRFPMLLIAVPQSIQNHLNALHSATRQNNALARGCGVDKLQARTEKANFDRETGSLVARCGVATTAVCQSYCCSTSRTSSSNISSSSLRMRASFLLIRQTRVQSRYLRLGPSSVAPQHRHLSKGFAKRISLNRREASNVLRKGQRPQLPKRPIATAMDAEKLHGKAGESEHAWMDEAPYRLHQSHEAFDVKHEASCHCGRVKYQLSREAPLDSKLCHCTDCQIQHGMLSAVVHLPAGRSSNRLSRLIFL